MNNKDNEELLQIQAATEMWQLNAIYSPGLELELEKKLSFFCYRVGQLVKSEY